MQLSRYCIVGLLTLLAGAGSWGRASAGQGGFLTAGHRVQAPASGQGAASGQGTSTSIAGDTEFTLFLNGKRVGTEQVRVAQAGTTWIVSSTAQFGPPLNATVSRFELKYTADWQPTELHIEAMQPGRTLALTTSFGVTTATNVITQNGSTSSKTDQISARSIVLPNNFYAGYVVLAARLAGTNPGAELPVYVAPSAEIRVSVKAITEEQINSPSGPLSTRLYDLTIQNPGSPIDALAAIDPGGRLLRFEIPSAGVRLIRTELASVSTRSQPIRNPTDTDVIIAGPGFNLAGTLTMPPGVGRLRYPAVVLAGGSGQVERDEVVAGIPIFAQLAGALAQDGLIVLRYDKRGIGQSGGRAERVTLQDYADDLTTAVRWLAKRPDVDSRQIAVAGHSEGGAVAMLAAAREKKIGKVILIAAPGKAGSELILEQQRHQLDALKTPEPERQAKIDLQQKIQAAVIADKGWGGIPPTLREQADSPWFRSLLLFDPAKVMPKVKQPILIIQGDLDTRVLPSHADTLAQLARARKKAAPVELLHLPGINHLLVPATTGEVSEYAGLRDRKVTPAVATAMAEWLKK
ncbi:MAG: alpha/beta fold hydrolase [Acidobacteriota bacterium]|nr:alpha/beta fold hydrolase [Acidobacteriota bacterium]